VGPKVRGGGRLMAGVMWAQRYAEVGA
jgi:hypothetical protein